MTVANMFAGLKAVVQYRRKDGASHWITMAAFDATGPAERYYEQQNRDENWPWEYQWLEIEGD